MQESTSALARGRNLTIIRNVGLSSLKFTLWLGYFLKNLRSIRGSHVLLSYVGSLNTHISVMELMTPRSPETLLLREANESSLREFEITARCCRTQLDYIESEGDV